MSAPAPSPFVVVVLPTYNEANGITTTIQRIRSALPSAHLLVVDDSSPDGTGRIVASIAARDVQVELMTRPGKEGLGRAYASGFRRALALAPNIVVQMDADLSHDPDELPALIAPIVAGAADLVVGSRRVGSGATVGWSRRRNALSHLGGLYARTILRLGVADPTGGYRAWSAPLLAAVTATPTTTAGYGFQIEMLWRARRVSARIVEVPITFRERASGVSKMTLRIAVEAALLVLQLALRRSTR
ncbi:MAG: hypothetical protein RIR19_843 [Chloroflexota bacterium]|jgi:dolichol-phosphate mannosyltransferase